jgi:hypothetical protein
MARTRAGGILDHVEGEPPKSAKESAPEVAAAAAPEPAEDKPDEAERVRKDLLALKRKSDAWKIETMFANPFPPQAVKFKPQMVKGNRCLAMPYIDARLVQERLDDAVGIDGWKDGYKLLPDGSVRCRLSVRVGDAWVTKEDVGSPSEQPDSGDRLKAAFSDALKRAAVKFGIGRYLYRLSAQWVDYDPVKKMIVQKPQLPAFAQPKHIPKDWLPYHGEDEVPEVAAAASEPAKEYPQAGGRIAAPAAERKTEPPKEVPRKDAVVGDQQAVIRDLIKECGTAISACGTPDDLNAMLPKFRGVPEFAKAAVWKYIQDTVMTDPINWKYSLKEKKFYAEPKAAVEDTIPY